VIIDETQLAQACLETNLLERGKMAGQARDSALSAN